MNEKNFNKLAEGGSMPQEEDEVNSRYREGLNHLKDGLKVGYEIEELGIEAQRQLEAHTNLLDRNLTRGEQIRRSLNDSGRLIKGMMNRITKNKVVLVGVIVIILSTVFIIVYLKLPAKAKK